MTKDELIQLTDDYAANLEAKAALDGEAKILKNNIIEELNKVDDDKFVFPSMTAKLTSRQGSVDMKALQIKYNISDSDLDLLRKPATKSWTFRRSI